MTSEELFNEASKLFPMADSVCATVTTQQEKDGGAPFTAWTIGARSSSALSEGFDIAYGYGYTPEECIVRAMADAETKRKNRPE